MPAKDTAGDRKPSAQIADGKKRHDQDWWRNAERGLVAEAVSLRHFALQQPKANIDASFACANDDVLSAVRGHVG